VCSFSLTFTDRWATFSRLQRSQYRNPPLVIFADKSNPIQFISVPSLAILVLAVLILSCRTCRQNHTQRRMIAVLTRCGSYAFTLCDPVTFTFDVLTSRLTSRVTRVMGFHPANLGFLGLSVLELGRGTRQTDSGRYFIMPSLYGGRGIIIIIIRRRRRRNKNTFCYYKQKLTVYCIQKYNATLLFTIYFNSRRKTNAQRQ